MDAAPLLPTDGASVRARPETRHKWIQASRIALVITYLLIAALAGGVIQQLATRHTERHVWSWAIAACFVGIAVPLSLHEIHLHVLHFVSPLQKHFIVILLMVPIYSIESWLALRFREQRIYLEVAREAYEALVLWSFMRLLLDFLGDDAEKALAKRPYTHAKLMWPFCCFRSCRLRGGSFVKLTSLCVFQYVVVRSVMSAVALISEWTDKFCEGEWTDVNCLYPWSTTIMNLSQLLAMYALVLFYHELRDELAPLRPLGKFLAIKFVVFFTFWQGIAIAGFVEAGWLTDTLSYTVDDVAAGVNDFLICLDMALAALIHRYTFSVSDFWREDLAERAPLFPGGRLRSAHAIGMVLTPSDMAQELQTHLRGVWALPLKLLPGRGAGANGTGDAVSGTAKEDAGYQASGNDTDSIAAPAPTLDNADGAYETLPGATQL